MFQTRYFGHLKFEFVSAFVLRISNLKTLYESQVLNFFAASCISLAIGSP
jgi:hypothetical protein